MQLISYRKINNSKTKQLFEKKLLNSLLIQFNSSTIIIDSNIQNHFDLNYLNHKKTSILNFNYKEIINKINCSFEKLFVLSYSNSLVKVKYFTKFAIALKKIEPNLQDDALDKLNSYIKLSRRHFNTKKVCIEVKPGRFTTLNSIKRNKTKYLEAIKVFKRSKKSEFFLPQEATSICALTISEPKYTKLIYSQISTDYAEFSFATVELVIAQIKTTLANYKIDQLAEINIIMPYAIIYKKIQDLLTSQLTQQTANTKFTCPDLIYGWCPNTTLLEFIYQNQSKNAVLVNCENPANIELIFNFKLDR